jgi:hypothetical protein
MRLSTDQIQAICQAATTAFGQGTSVWLFGSRVDDAKRGGAIDLLVCQQLRSADDAAGPQQTFMQKFKMLTLLERQLGDLAQVLHGNGRHGARQLPLATDVQAPEGAEASLNVPKVWKFSVHRVRCLMY